MEPSMRLNTASQWSDLSWVIDLFLKQNKRPQIDDVQNFQEQLKVRRVEFYKALQQLWIPTILPKFAPYQEFSV
jgi:hypothetical protein